MSRVTVDISQGIATITFNRPEALNAITQDDYHHFANALREINEREDVLVTVWQATGKWFCAGTHVKGSANRGHEPSVRYHFLNNIAQTGTDCGHALSSHNKILVAALNGPVMAFLGHFDFIYALPHVWLSVPFTFLGLVAEGGSSVTFINRMGLAKANEVLIWGKKKEAPELLECGFLNKIYPAQPTEQFHAAVRSQILDDLQGLDPVALLTSKKLIHAGLNDRNNFDATNLRESYEQARMFAGDVPRQRFGAIARKEIKHKL
ncbi:hypothetical protein PLICRDRAFT_111157 [Plicaturopsis crispa FD-325 SS-3]|nr:hypothetical protein PLICRDRAFT_111157 [Plicaturopsis crispa FD-325 SS-3]